MQICYESPSPRGITSIVYFPCRPGKSRREVDGMTVKPAERVVPLLLIVKQH